MASDFNPHILAGLAQKGEKSIENYIDGAGGKHTSIPETVLAQFDYKIERVINTAN